MAHIRQETRINLERRELIELGVPGRQTLACHAGEVWITFDGSRKDVILKAGEQLVLDGRRGVVLSALQPARLTLSAEPGSDICLLDPGRAAWAWARRLRWQFPALATFPATHLR